MTTFVLFIQHKGTDLFTRRTWNFLRFQVYILEYFLRTLKRVDDENRHICVYYSVSLVSHRNYCCRPRRISCPAMLALLTGYNILQYNSKGLWKAKIISIAAE